MMSLVSAVEFSKDVDHYSSMFSFVYFNMLMYFIKAAPVTNIQFKGLVFLVHSLFLEPYLVHHLCQTFSVL